ncbi:MAG: outer membrane protein assembly factor BamA [Kiritimatiellia bacterium]|nr:outer membrane protein assembly factor BamA [Kiritimatiellia bacterium]
MNRTRWFALACFILGLAFAPGVEAAEVRIREIRIVNLGPGPLLNESVLPLLSMRVGEPFDRAAVIADVRALQGTGRFSQVDVRAEPQGDEVTLIVAIRSKPLLSSLIVEGSSAVGNRRIGELLGISPGNRVDHDILSAGALRVQEEYYKRYHPDAKVNWDLQVEEETGRATVRVRITEGPRARVRDIRFKGVHALAEKDLRAVLRQTRKHPLDLWGWIVGKGRFEPDLAESDSLALRRAYLDRGYLDAVVEGPALERDGRQIRILFTVREGQPYRIGTLTLSGNTLFDEATLTRIHGLRSGDPASLSKIEEATTALQDFYGHRGYFRTSVRRVLDADAQTGRVDVRLEIREGRLSRVRDVQIQGNVVTRDKVIRRELVVSPGDQHDSSRVRSSERRLRNLGYFSDVSVSTAETPQTDAYDLIFQVEEGRMGMVSAGVGFSSIESMSGYFEVSHGNFAIDEWPPVGAGQKLRLRGQIGTRSNTIETEFTEPWLFDQPLSLGINLFRSEQRYLSSDYDQRNTGGRISLTRALSPFWRIGLEYGLQNIEIFDVSDTASLSIREEEGKRLKSSMTLSLTHDTRRMDFRGAVPSGGHHLRLSADYAGGPLGGDTDLYAWNAQGSQFLSLWWKHILILRGRAGVVESTGDSDRIPLFDRYFLGGPTNVRGFRYRGIGPRDENEEPIGGSSLAFASVEYSFPLFPSVRGGLFYDTGAVWAEAYDFDSEWSSSYGLGLRLDIPMLPIRLDYAWPLETDEFTEKNRGRFSFWIGHSF